MTHFLLQFDENIICEVFEGKTLLHTSGIEQHIAITDVSLQKGYLMLFRGIILL